MVEPLESLHVAAADLGQDEAVTSNPTEKLRCPARNAKPRQIANAARVEQLLDGLPDEERAVWALAFYGGLRVGELRALRWSDVDFDTGVIRVQRAWDDVEGEAGDQD